MVGEDDQVLPKDVTRYCVDCENGVCTSVKDYPCNMCLGMTEPVGRERPLWTPKK